MAEIKGSLKKVSAVILKSVPTPGKAGRDGVDGRDGLDAPSKDELIESLKNDNEFLKTLLEKRELEFDVVRDDNLIIQNIIVKSKFKEEDE